MPFDMRDEDLQITLDLLVLSDLWYRSLFMHVVLLNRSLILHSWSLSWIALHKNGALLTHMGLF